MTYKILNIEDVDFSKISCGMPYITGQIVVVPIYYEKKLPLIVKLPELFCDTIYNESHTNIKLSMIEKNERNVDHINIFFKLIDQFISDNANQKYKQWKLKKNIRYKSPFVEGDDITNNVGSLKLLVYESQEFSTKVFLNNKKEIKKNQLPTYINGNCYVKSIIEFSSINIVDGINMNIYLKTHQLKVSPGNINIVIINEYAFSDSESETSNNNYLENFENECKTEDDDDNDNEQINNQNSENQNSLQQIIHVS